MSREFIFGVKCFHERIVYPSYGVSIEGYGWAHECCVIIFSEDIKVPVPVVS